MAPIEGRPLPPPTARPRPRVTVNTNVRHIDMLVPDELTTGRVHRLAMRVGDDALNRPVAIPMLAARGRKPGPVVGLTAVVHGNELNGIAVIHRLFDSLDVEHMRGTVVAAVVVNVPGFLGRRRLLVEGADLNHHFPGDPVGPPWRIYAHRVMDRIVRHVDLLLDLHTASTGRVNTLYVRADMHDARTARLAHLQRPQIIVHSPAADGTLRGAASDLGIPAITVEVGNPQRIQRDVVRGSVRGLRAVLVEAGVLPRRKVQLGPAPVVCSSSHWLYTNQGGLLRVLPGLGDRVSAGEEVATLVDPWGQHVESYRAPTDGIVIGHSVDPVADTGARILHLGAVAPEGSGLHDHTSASSAWRAR